MPGPACNYVLMISVSVINLPMKERKKRKKKKEVSNNYDVSFVEPHLWPTS